MQRMEDRMNQVNRFSRCSLIAMAAMVALVVMASAAAAFPARSPQVAVGGTGLQTYFNGVGESINVGTDQLDAQVWSSTISGNSTFTLMVELTANTPTTNAIGIYNSN